MTTNDPTTHISIPDRKITRRFRQRIIPVLIWALAVISFWTVNREQAGYQYAIGIVEIQDAVIVPLNDGTIRSLPVDLFDTVKAGDVVVMMDDTLIVAELAVEEAQLGQLKSELDVERNRLKNSIELSAIEELDDLRRYQLDEEKSRLDYLELRVDVEAKQIKLERLKIQMERQKSLLESAIGNQSLFDDIRLRHAELNKELPIDQAALATAQNNVEKTSQRRIEREKTTSPSTLTTVLYLEPFLQKLKVQEARRHELQEERLTLMLRAPIDGQIAKLYYGPGETVLSGTPVLSIQSPTARRVIAYLDESAAGTIHPNREVYLRSATRPNVTAKARVLRTGSSLEALPRRIWSTPLIGEWGFPVLIGDIPEGLFLPAETVNIQFR